MPASARAELKTRAFLSSGLAWSLAVALSAVARTASAELNTRAFLFSGLAWSLAVALSAVARTSQCGIEHARFLVTRARLVACSLVVVMSQVVRTAFLLFVGRDGCLLVVCDFKIGISKFRCVFCFHQVRKSVYASAPSPFFHWISCVSRTTFSCLERFRQDAHLLLAPSTRTAVEPINPPL
jgi:hypothetical protein